MVELKTNEQNKKHPGVQLLQNGSLQDQEIKRFYQSNVEWFEERFQESEIACALPVYNMPSEDLGPYKESGWNNLWDLSAEDATTEFQFWEFCERHQWFGIDRNLQPVFCPLVYRRSHRIDFEEFRKILPPDWSLDTARQNYDAVKRADEASIFERRESAAGWMICDSRFREQRDHLRTLWRNLPANGQPVLPLSRSSKMASLPSNTDFVPQPELLEFTRQFDQFCDSWHLLGMVTWDLPDPEGSHDLGDLGPHFPWTFPSLAEDGYDLTEREQALKLALQNGFEDQKHWKTYSHILKIHFWERIAVSRYSSKRTRKINKSKLDILLSNILEIDPTRVKKLRLWKDKLIKGEINSLIGRR